MSYCSERLMALHITEELNTWKTTDHEGHTRDFKFFTPFTKFNAEGVERDDISINYIAPDGVVEREFVFRGVPYFQNGEGKVVKSWHGQAMSFPKIACQFFRG